MDKRFKNLDDQVFTGYDGLKPGDYALIKEYGTDNYYSGFVLEISSTHVDIEVIYGVDKSVEMTFLLDYVVKYQRHKEGT